MKNIKIVFCFMFLSMFLFATSANAYIDPSVLTYVIQAVAGICVTLGVVLTVFRHKIIKFFRNLKYRKK